MIARTLPKAARNDDLRAPCPADYLALSAWIKSAEDCARWAGPRVRFPFSAQELPTLLALAEAQSHILAQADDTPCGFGQYWVLEPSWVHLGRLIIAPASRGQGHGRRLCEQLMARAIASTGAKTVSLRVYRDNAIAVRLYSNLGFVASASESRDEVLFMRRSAALSLPESAVFRPLSKERP